MTIPDYQSLMLPVLRKAEKGEVRISDVIEQLADELELSADEKAEKLPSGRQTTFANRVHWARTYLKQAGLLAPTRRAHFRISDIGYRIEEGPFFQKIQFAWTTNCFHSLPSSSSSKLGRGKTLGASNVVRQLSLSSIRSSGHPMR